jgi:DNA-binding Lrp family transcriptional regulator
MPDSVTLDRFDHALLEQVQINNQLPARHLAERVGLSESAVLRRLRRLRREGVIAADRAVVHPAILGLPLTMHVLVSLEREGSAVLDAFTRKLRGRPEVRQAWYVTGEADFVLRLQLANMEASAYPVGSAASICCAWAPLGVFAPWLDPISRVRWPSSRADSRRRRTAGATSWRAGGRTASAARGAAIGTPTKWPRAGSCSAGHADTRPR